MKFLIISSYPGSILKFRGALIKALQDKGFEIHIAAPEFEVFPEEYESLTALGYVVHPIYMQRTGTNPLNDAKTLSALYLLMKRLSLAMLWAIPLSQSSMDHWQPNSLVSQIVLL